MKRMTPKVQLDTCPTCQQPVLTAGYDDRWGVQDSIIVDPTPMDTQAEMACILLGRARYVLEGTAVKTYRLGRITEYLHEQAIFAPALHLPAHRCTARLPGHLPLDVLTNLGALPSGQPVPADAPF